MQLCLDAADRLVELVEDRRGPVPADEAARTVLKLGTAVPVGLARSLLDEAVARRRAAPLGRRPRRAAMRPARRLRSSSATFVVFDLETTGLRPGTARPARSARCASRARAAERFQTLANPGRALQPRRRRAHRPARRASYGARRRCRGGPALPRVRRRRGARRAQRALRHGVPRQRDDAADGPPRRGDRRRHRRARAPAARPRSPANLGCARLPLRVPMRGRATARCRTPRRPPRSCCACSGWRRSAAPDRRRPRRARRDEAAARARQAAASRSARRSGPASTSSATRTTRCCTSARRATCAPGCARTSARERQRPAVEAALGALERDRVARARLRARGGARGAPADPRAPAARERALGTARPLRLPAAARRHRGLLREAGRARPDHEPAPRPARGASVAGRRVGDARRRAAEASEKLQPARARPALRGCGTAPRPDRGAGGGRAREVARLERLRELAVCLVVPGERRGPPARASSSRRARSSASARFPARRSRMAGRARGVARAEPTSRRKRPTSSCVLAVVPSPAAARARRDRLPTLNGDG